MRLFVALSPPPEALAEIAAALGSHREAWPELRWTAPETWHVTMAFLGEVPERVLPDLTGRLGRAVGRYQAVTLVFGAGGAFPSAARAQVVWLGLAGGEPVLPRLAASLAAGARRAGVEMAERRRFRPHLTVARARPRAGIDVRPLVESLRGFAGSPWHAGHVHLVRSHLGATVRYEILETWPLGGAGVRGSSAGRS
ncbi:RNA 2',3'-cyclic phosphodiesterase [Sphaerisporangium rufum]|uniref:RNA 2',3'-cyclic phosphodiesterase n=1 Tax=Sphaerisporangium rufum TaxID=1381558 RepID=A0A919V6Q4_9ACTN|nr:RNA 2',3'-cyclic phosphodiesterase [Sphaerisporangium rufum]GII79590.1 RNA 2',3'-cyclic phosphodiesterase [Sphaerisporangium rufum]